MKRRRDTYVGQVIPIGGMLLLFGYVFWRVSSLTL